MTMSADTKGRVFMLRPKQSSELWSEFKDGELEQMLRESPLAIAIESQQHIQEGWDFPSKEVKR